MLCKYCVLCVVVCVLCFCWLSLIVVWCCRLLVVSGLYVRCSLCVESLAMCCLVLFFGWCLMFVVWWLLIDGCCLSCGTSHMRLFVFGC